MKRIIILIISITMFSIVYAGGVGTTGANYLKIGLGAKAPALGDSFTAMADDVSALYWNTAGLTKTKTKQIDFMQLNWVAGISAKTFSGIYPLSDTDFIGGYLFMMDTPSDKETVYDDSGFYNYSETGDSFSSKATIINVAYSKLITSQLSLGLGLKTISEDLAGEKANGFAMDAGLLYEGFYPNLTLGAAVQNIGISRLRPEEELPMTIALGAAYQMDFMANKLNLLTDVKMPNDNDAILGLGAEYWLGNSLAGRIGYNTANKFSFGLGIVLEGLSADYAYVPLGELGITHRISVGYKFNIAGAEEETKSAAEIVMPSKVTEENINDLFDGSETEPSPAPQQIITPAETPASAEPTTEVLKTEPAAASENIIDEFDF